MSTYIGEKCLEIEIHAKRLYDREDFTGRGLEQEYLWVLQAVGVIKNQAEHMEERIGALAKIESVLVEGGKPEITVAKIRAIMEDSNAKIGVPGLRIAS